MSENALLRLTLGVNIALHGIMRIVGGESLFVAHLLKKFAGSPLPSGLVTAFAYTLPWAEAVIGLLVLFGAATRMALIAGGALMVVLTFGTALLQDWNTAELQLVYAVVYFLLLRYLRHNQWSLDGLLRPGHSSQGSG